MISKHFINKDIFEKTESLNKTYISNEPFPHIIVDDLFENEILDKILEEFPKELGNKGEIYNNKAEKKVTLNKTENLSDSTNNFINFLNSNIFIRFLQKLTSINETLIPDPLLIGGGLHELKNGGFLNIHSDFNRHPKTMLDRRLNVLIYLNKDWKEEYGGELQLWDKNMEKCYKKINPLFNRMVVFSTTDFSYHGNPTLVKNPNNISRKSIAMYYYSNGRPENEVVLGDHSTIFRKRPGSSDIDGNLYYKKIFGKLYIRTKKKIK